MNYQRFRLAWRCKQRFPAGAATCCLILLLSVSVGCRRTGPEVVPIRGTVTFGGGPWPKPGIVYFVAESPSAGRPQRPAMGEFDNSGTLTVTTFRKGDGLIPGKYRAALECWETPPKMGSPPILGKSYVPERYRSAASSGLIVLVEEGQKMVAFNLDVPKAP
jgi:hypothetical protein